MYRTTESSTVSQILFMVILIINFYISIVNSEAAANPKSFTDDPFIDDEKFMERVVKHEVPGVVGESVSIPCNCTPAKQHPGDKPVLILWYKDTGRVPIYSFDLRQASGDGQHWKDHMSLGDRGFVYYEESPHSCKSYLNIEPVVAGDSGQYRCRVDYQTSPTRNTKIKLKLIARPSKPVILEEDGEIIGERTKPVQLGSSLKLYCRSQDGDPLPSLSWRRGGVPVPAAGQSLDTVAGVVTSSVVIDQVTPGDQGLEISCTADNSVLIQPQTSSVKLDIIVPPIRAKIVREWNYFTANTTYNVTCQVLGSRPTASIQMWVGPKPLKTMSTEVGDDGNICTSLIQFTPGKEDDQKFLSCQGQNELIEESGVEDQWKITVYYKPEVTLLREGRNNDSLVVTPSEDVSLKCSIVANPGHHTVQWTKQGDFLEPGGHLGNVHLLDETLYINGFRKENVGDYRCVVTNQAGTSTSNSLQLTITAAPQCAIPETQMITIGGDADNAKELNLDCFMRWRDTSSLLKYTWTMVNSFNNQTIPMSRKSIDNGNISTIMIPHTSLIGVSEVLVYCKAAGTDGLSGDSCKYHINNKDMEHFVFVCNVFNQTFSSFTVDCSHVERKSYQFEIVNIHTGEIVRNISTSSPRVTFVDLPSASEFIITVYSDTHKKLYSLEGFTTRDGEKQLATMPELEGSYPYGFIPMFGGFVLISLLLVLVIITTVAIARRKFANSRSRSSSQQQVEVMTLAGDGPDSIDYSPDIIPKEQGYGYCTASIEDLRQDKEVVMTTQLLLDESSQCFKRPDSYYTELSFAKFTGDTFKIPVRQDKKRHNTASSTSTEYAQIMTCVSSDHINPDVGSSSDLQSSNKNQNNSISDVTPCEHSQIYTIPQVQTKQTQNIKSSQSMKRVKFEDQ